jgi:hypothetical protein
MALSPAQVEIVNSLFEEKNGHDLKGLLLLYVESVGRAAVQEGEEKYEDLDIEQWLISMIQAANAENPFQNKFEATKIDIKFNEALEKLFEEYQPEIGVAKLKEHYMELLKSNLKSFSEFVEVKELVEQAELWLSNIRRLITLKLELTNKDETKQELTGIIDNLVYELIEWGLLDKAQK